MSENGITFWNRKYQKYEQEKVYGQRPMEFLYTNKVGQSITNSLLAKSFFSKLYGSYQSSKLSSHKIPNFINNFQIPMEEYEIKTFSSFNDFFIRNFKCGARPFTDKENELAAFAEARYLGFAAIDPKQSFPVKGMDLSISTLMDSFELSNPFVGGPCLIARLCPVDYHRFHFPCDGTYLKYYKVPGKLHSVNPLALKSRSDIFVTNAREVSILETNNFGKICYIEVGALCVGRIVQSHSVTGSFKRGEEKGYFLFGGSTVIIFGEKARWLPSPDILEKTREKCETLVRLGDTIGVK